MNTDRIALAFVAATCLTAVSACHRASVPSDAQLTRLLHVERASPTDPAAPIDAAAVECLKAWSGETELVASLPLSMTGDAAKQACRPRLDGWIADAGRNPDKLTFAVLAAPPTVRRAMGLLAEHRPNVAQRLPTGIDQLPRALTSTDAPASAKPAIEGPVDFHATAAAVDELDGYCKKATQAAASGNTVEPLSRYASYCDKRIAQLRERLSILQQQGDSPQAKILSERIQRMLAIAREVASKPTGTPESH